MHTAETPVFDWMTIKVCVSVGYLLYTYGQSWVHLEPYDKEKVDVYMHNEQEYMYSRVLESKQVSCSYCEKGTG